MGAQARSARHPGEMGIEVEMPERSSSRRSGCRLSPLAIRALRSERDAELGDVVGGRRRSHPSRWQSTVVAACRDRPSPRPMDERGARDSPSRFGSTGARPRSSRRLGAAFQTTRESIRQIEAKACRSCAPASDTGARDLSRYERPHGVAGWTGTRNPPRAMDAPVTPWLSIGEVYGNRTRGRGVSRPTPLEGGGAPPGARTPPIREVSGAARPGLKDASEEAARRLGWESHEEVLILQC